MTTSSFATITDPTQHAPDDLLTITEVSAIVRAPEGTLRYWRHLGTGPRSFRLGRHVVYRARDVNDWIEQQRTATADRQHTAH